MSNPFAGPSQQQVKQHKLQSSSFQDFISATPLPGYVFDPRLALYIDPNIPAGLYPRFVQVAHPTINGMQNVEIPVGAGSKTPTKFLEMLGGTDGLKPGMAAQVQAASGQPADTPDPFGGWGSVITGPTSRPNEPVTTGLPFGDGASFIQMPGEDESRFRSRVVQSLLNSPSTTPEVKAFALRMQKGE